MTVPTPLLPRLSVLALVLTLAACGPESTEADRGAMQGAPPTDTTPAPAEPQIEDGVQVVEIEAGLMGYEPRAVALEAGVPVRLVFTRTVESECSSQITVPAFGVPPTDLPLNEPVAVEFTPAESGEFAFVCGMDMQRGALLIQS
jgi:hypothetical protein